GGYAAIVRWIRAGAKFGPEAVPVRAPVAGSSRPATTRPKRADATSSVPSVAPTDAAEGAPSEPSPGAEASPSTPASPPAVPPYYVAFVPRVHDALMKACASCHSTTGFAAKSKYLTDADPGKHFSSARALVAPGSAESSTLYIRAHGEGHPAGAVWAKGSAELALLAQWINEGAHDVAAPVVASAGTGEPPAAGAVDAVSRASVAPAGAETGASDQGANPHAGISLGTHPFVGALTLNGRFDLNYERRDYNDNPFAGSANHVLRSYHHFLFLTRESADDPIHITLEMLTLQFWEVGARLSPGAWPVRVSAKFGKVLVPFGSEPLFHHSYGGLAGFDQRVLPPVFAREGIKFNAEGKLGEVALSADLYAIAGYGLKAADGVLNLQSDFAPLEDTRLGFGARLGGSWGALSGWYSLYYNRLGYDRALVLQALDFAVWRPHGVPVFEDFSLELGALRADVSGGGPGLDYYHFATYFQVRYYPLAWLYLQYRQGIFTFNNRRGLIVDESDLTDLDSSSHNIGIVARYRGFSVGLFQFWNFERADEIPNDFTRLMVAYDF
ncbi:MAG: hypothetical protein KC417_14260, partial [Myxococcales bacterium]|nr:hypothetical protein [Myxococcales bacterium]